MNALIKGKIQIIVIGTEQYVMLVFGQDNGSIYYRKWSTNEELIIDYSFTMNYIQSVNIDFDGNDCLIDEHGSEYYKVINHIF